MPTQLLRPVDMSGVPLVPGPHTHAAGDLTGLTAALAEKGAAVDVAALLADRLLASTSPFVILSWGQSNASGSDEAGDKTILSGIRIWDGAAMVPAAFGSGPLVGGNNNFTIHFANELRRSGLIPASREIWILPSWHPGQSISQWVGAGTASPYWAEIVAMVAAAGVSRIDACVGAQGEADSTTAETGYNTRDLYARGFETLKAQLRAQTWFPASTPIIQQELGAWLANGAQARNDYWATADLDDPWVRVSSSAGLTMGSGPDDTAHFSGDSLVKIGRRMFGHWASARLGRGAPAGARTPEGLAQARLRTLAVPAGGALDIGPDDLRTGAEIASQGGTLNLPNASYVPGSTIVVSVWSAASGATVVSCAQPIGDVPWQVDATTVSLEPGIHMLMAVRGRWRYVASNLAEIGLRQAGTLTPSGSPYDLSAIECAGNAWICNAGSYRLPNPNSIAGRRAVALIAAGDITVSAAAGAIHVGGIGPLFATDPITIPAGHVVVFRPTSNARWGIFGGTWRLDARRVISATAPVALGIGDCGATIINTGAAVAVEHPLPTARAGLWFRAVCKSAAGLSLRASASSVDRIADGAALSAVGGVISTTTVNSTVTLEAVDVDQWVVVAKTGTWTLT